MGGFRDIGSRHSKAPNDKAPNDKAPFGLRLDGTPKGMGFLGKLERPDGKISTELSIGFEVGGKEVLMPALVPTLTPEEIDILLNSKEGDRFPDIIYQKAYEHGIERIKRGESPFFD